MRNKCIIIIIIITEPEEKAVVSADTDLTAHYPKVPPFSLAAERGLVRDLLSEIIKLFGVKLDTTSISGAQRCVF
jgi:hypothetical protein